MRICTKFSVEMGSGEIGWAVDVAQRRRVDGDVAGAEGFERLVQRAHADAEQRLELADRSDRPAGEARMPAPGDGDDRWGRRRRRAPPRRSGRAGRMGDDRCRHRSANQRTASMTPPSGPSPGHVSARTSRPVAAVSRDWSPPTSTTGRAAGSVEHGAHVLDHRLAPTSIKALSRPSACLAAAQHGAAGARRLGRQDGGLVGSSWSRNCSQRAASSCSPISAAVRCRPSSAGSRRWSAPPSARSRIPASRSPAARRGRGR